MAKYWRETKIGDLTEERAGKTRSLYIPPGSSCLASSTHIPPPTGTQLRERRAEDFKDISPQESRLCQQHCSENFLFEHHKTISLLCKSSEKCNHQDSKYFISHFESFSITSAFSYLVLIIYSRLKSGEWARMSLCKCNAWWTRTTSRLHFYLQEWVHSHANRTGWWPNASIFYKAWFVQILPIWRLENIKSLDEYLLLNILFQTSN